MITFPSRERATRSDSMPTDTNTSSSQPQQSNPPKRSKSKSRTRSEKNQDDPSLVSRKRANSESATPKRSHSKKDKINAVSKASLAMLDPRHAMGMDSEYGQESYFSYGDSEEDPKEREEYDGIWGEEKSMGGGGEINNNQAGRGRKNAAATLPKWSDQKIDPAWQMSPTPTLEAFAAGNNFDADAPSSLDQIISSTFVEPEVEEEDLPAFDSKSNFVSVFEDDQEPTASSSAPTLHRQGTLSRVMLRSGSDQSDGGFKNRNKNHKDGSQSISFIDTNVGKKKSRKSSSPNTVNQGLPPLPSSSSSSISRFFSWKRANKDKNAPAPLVLNILGAPSEFMEYPYNGPSSAPPNVTTFEDAARFRKQGSSAPANITTFKEAAARDGNSMFSHSSTVAPTLDAQPQWAPLDLDRNFDAYSSPSSSSSIDKSQAGHSQAMGFSLSAQGSRRPQEQEKRISTLGRKHSLPTMREQERASRQSVWMPPPQLPSSTSKASFESSSSKGRYYAEKELHSSPSLSSVALPVLPAIPICTNSPTLFATPAWEASLSRFMDEPSSPSSWSISTGTSNRPLSKVSTLGRGVPNRKSTFEPAGKQSSPTKEPRCLPLRSESNLPEVSQVKVLRRVSRSVGSFNAPPPLSSFGSPPTFFSPRTPDVNLFSLDQASNSPSMVSSPLGFGRGRGVFQSLEQQNPIGRGRGVGSGTPTQRSVSTFAPIISHQPQIQFKEERLSMEEVSRESISPSSSGTPKLGHSPSDSTDSMASLTGSSEVHLSTQQARRVNLQQIGRAVPVGIASPSLLRSPRAAFTKTHISDLVVTVMPPTPDLRQDSPTQGEMEGNQGHVDKSEEECMENAYGEGMTTEVAKEIERSFSPVSSIKKVKGSRSPEAWRRRDTCIIDGPETMRSPLGLGLELQSTDEPRSSVIDVSSGQQLPMISQDNELDFYGLPYMERKEDSDSGLGLDLGMDSIMRRRVDSVSSLLSDCSASTGSAEPFGFSRSLSSMSLASDTSSLGGSGISTSYSNLSSTTDLTSPAKSFKSSSSSSRRRVGENQEDQPPLVPMLQFGSENSIHDRTFASDSPSASRESSPSSAIKSATSNFLDVGLPLRVNNLSTTSISSALSGITASTSILNLEEDQELEAEKFAKEQGLFSHRPRIQQEFQSQSPLKTAFSSKANPYSANSSLSKDLNEDDCETPKLGSGGFASPNSQFSSPYSQPRTSPIEETESELRSAINELPSTWLSNSQSSHSALPKPSPPNKPPKSRARSNSIYQSPSKSLQVDPFNGSEASTSPAASPRAPLRPLALVQAQGKKDDKISEGTRPLFIKRPQPRNIVNHQIDNRGKENIEPTSKRSTHYVSQLASPLSTSTSSRFASNFSPSSPRDGLKSSASTPSPPLSVGLGIGLGFDFDGNSRDEVTSSVSEGNRSPMTMTHSPSWRSDLSSEDCMGFAM